MTWFFHALHILLVHCLVRANSTFYYQPVDGVLDLSNGAFKNTSIKNDTFTLANTNVENVTKLDLSGNRITDVDVESFNALFNLKVLILANNSIEHLNNETFTSLRKLEELDVSHNGLTELRAGLVSVLTLREIRFNNNNISYVEPGIVGQINIHLSVFNLSYNNLPNLDPWMYLTYDSGERYVDRLFDVQHNAIRELTNKMGWKYDLEYAFQVNVLAQYNAIPEISLDIIQQYDQTVNPSDQSLFALFLTFYMNITNNPFFCDCKVYDIAAEVRGGIFQYTRVEEWRYRCGGPAHLEGWDFIHDLPLHNLVCNHTESDGCPSGCHCQDRPHNDTYYIDCTGAGLSELPSTLPENNRSKIEMFMDDNFITEISNVPYLSRIFNLTLRNNELKSLNAEILKDMTAKKLDLRNNQITTLPKEIKKFESVQLTGNPLECDCNSMWMKQWMDIDTRNADPDLTCTANNGDILHIIEMTLRDLGCTNEALIIALVCLGVFLGLIIVGAIFAKRCPYETKVIIFRFFKVHPGKKYDVDNDKEKEIDAYLVFDHEDGDVIGYVRYFLHRLGKQKPLFSILNPAQFMEAGPESRNISKYIGKSRRVIIFLSKGIFNDEWRMNEIEEAEHRQIEAVTIKNNEISKKAKQTKRLNKNANTGKDKDDREEDKMNDLTEICIDDLAAGNNDNADELEFQKREEASLKKAPKLIYIIYNTDETLTKQLEEEPWKSRLDGKTVLRPDPDDHLFWSKVRYEMPQKGNGNGKPFMPFDIPKLERPLPIKRSPVPSPKNPKKQEQKRPQQKTNGTHQIQNPRNNFTDIVVNSNQPGGSNTGAHSTQGARQKVLKQNRSPNLSDIPHTINVHKLIRPDSADSAGSDVKTRLSFIGGAANNSLEGDLMNKIKQFSNHMHKNGPGNIPSRRSYLSDV